MSLREGQGKGNLNSITEKPNDFVNKKHFLAWFL